MYNMWTANMSYANDLMDKILFPIHPALIFYDSMLLGKHLSTFDLINGGQFIGDISSFNNECLLGVIDLIGSILQIVPGHKHVDFDKKIQCNASNTCRFC